MGNFHTTKVLRKLLDSPRSSLILRHYDRHYLSAIMYPKRQLYMIILEYICRSVGGDMLKRKQDERDYTKGAGTGNLITPKCSIVFYECLLLWLSHSVGCPDCCALAVLSPVKPPVPQISPPSTRPPWLIHWVASKPTKLLPCRLLILFIPDPVSRSYHKRREAWISTKYYYMHAGYG